MDLRIFWQKFFYVSNIGIIATIVIIMLKDFMRAPEQKRHEAEDSEEIARIMTDETLRKYGPKWGARLLKLIEGGVIFFALSYTVQFLFGWVGLMRMWIK